MGSKVYRQIKGIGADNLRLETYSDEIEGCLKDLSVEISLQENSVPGPP